MGVDDQVIVHPEEMNYLLEHNETHIRITIPIGAEGGKLEVSTNTFEGPYYGCFQIMIIPNTD